MKLAWLCYTHSWHEASRGVVIEFTEPESWRYFKIVPIVYAEIKHD